MRSEFKSATHIYVNPIHFEIQLILRNDLFSHDDQNWWNRKNCPKFIHGVMRCEFKSAIYFELQLIFLFLHGPDGWNRKNCSKFIHRVIFAFWIQICNPNLCKSHIFWITANIEKWSFFAFLELPDDQNRWNRKNCPKFFHRVIFAFWIQICNPNLCKSHTFWNTANIENDLFCMMTKIDEIGKIARNSFIG